MQPANSTLRSREHALTLEFSEVGPAPATRCGPYAELRADAQVLREPGGKEIARHRDHCWFIGRQRYFRIDCDGPVRLHFENPDGTRSPVFGPFFHFSSADGIAYGDGQICAHVDVDANLWYSHQEQKHWKEMVVVPAG